MNRMTETEPRPRMNLPEKGLALRKQFCRGAYSGYVGKESLNRREEAITRT